jgi:molybdate transport system substrate-binding protein
MSFVREVTPRSPRWIGSLPAFASRARWSPLRHRDSLGRFRPITLDITRRSTVLARISRLVCSVAMRLAIVAAFAMLAPRVLAAPVEDGASSAPLVAAAADLRFALDEVAAQFARDTGLRVRVVYGSSGNFRRQIAEGGPFELFLSADEAYVLALAKEGYLVDDGVLYAIGRIALVIPEGSPLRPDPSLQDLAAAVAAGRVGRFAIANPEHAPYGRAAREALTAAGAWEGLQGRLVLGENVAQAAQFAVSGSAQGGIVALSLALAPGALAGARHVTIPASMHQPLRQRMALTKRATETARVFYRYLQSPAATAILQRYGFTAAGA